MASSNINVKVKRYNGTDWDNLYQVTVAENVIYGNNNVGVKLGSIDTNISNLQSHVSNKNNPHEVTKSQVGLGNVDNKSAATLKSEFTSTITAGNTGFATGGDVNNAIAIASVIVSVYVPKGSILFANLGDPEDAEIGWVYDIKDEFTTNNYFVEGAGHSYPAGTNVVCIYDTTASSNKWDVLAGSVDLSGYVPTSRKVNNKALTADITLSASDISVSAYNDTIANVLADIYTVLSGKQASITAERGAYHLEQALMLINWDIQILQLLL